MSPLFLCPCQKCDASKHKVLVASMCPQSLPFFAVKFGLDITEAAHKVCGFLKSLGEAVGFIYHCLLPPHTHRYLSWTLDILPHFWLSLCCCLYSHLSGSHLQECSMCSTPLWRQASASWRVRRSLFRGIAGGTTTPTPCPCSPPPAQVKLLSSSPLLSHHILLYLFTVFIPHRSD